MPQATLNVITTRGAGVMPGKTKKENGKPLEEIECFVIMPISTQKGYNDGHFQLVYEDIIQPSVKAAGMNAYRADETKNTNLIQLDILRRVIETPISVCDMSAKNPNVFYELGMRQAFDMPTVLLKDDATETPFDISGLRYVTYNKEMRHRDVISVIDELTDSINETYQKKDDKAEINSLIRLMELANPAKLNHAELSDEARYEKLNELHLKEIMSSIENLNMSQSLIISQLNRVSSESKGKKSMHDIRDYNIHNKNGMISNSLSNIDDEFEDFMNKKAL